MREALYRISNDLRSHVQRCLTHWPFVNHRQLPPDLVVDGDGIHVRFEISQPRLRQAMRIAAVSRAWNNYTVPELLGQAIIDPILVVGLLSTRRQTGAVTVEEGREEILMPISMAFRQPVQVVRPPMTGHDHHAHHRGVPRTPSDEMILSGLRFDQYELTLSKVHLPPEDRDLEGPAHHGVTTPLVRRRPTE